MENGYCSQVNRKGRSFTQPGLDAESTPAFLDKPLYNAQSESCTALRGKKRQEYLRENLGRDSRSRVDDGDLQQRGDVIEVFKIEHALLGPISTGGNVNRLRQ